MADYYKRCDNHRPAKAPELGLTVWVWPCLNCGGGSDDPRLVGLPSSVLVIEQPDAGYPASLVKADLDDPFVVFRVERRKGMTFGDGWLLCYVGPAAVGKEGT